ncbi:MAG: VanW family protein [Candidatus Blackburnbacteria bacterium]|nr:VanW family protein [Candidatus Blackburnbacteria bacterium]
MFLGRIYPGIKISNINVSGLTSQEASDKIAQIKPPSLLLKSENPKFETTLSLEIVYNTQESAQQALKIGRASGVIQATLEKWTALTKSVNLPATVSVDQKTLEQELTRVADQLSVPAIEPGVLVYKGEIVVNQGKDGIEVDKEALQKQITERVAYNKSDPITIPLKQTSSHLENMEVELIHDRAKNILGKKLEINFEYQNFHYDDSDTIPLLSPNGIRTEKLKVIVDDIKKTLDRAPIDARLVFESGKVREFTPAKDGIDIESDQLLLEIHAAIENLVVSEDKTAKIEVPAKRTKPDVSTSEVNNLGITELIGRGSSKFVGSTPSRVHNVTLAASRLNGILIKPGDTLSFNNALGDVSVYTGYQQAYVIRDGRTILGDGGGVCQVSTTLFRAALNTGLPIIERKAHSYRVGYYEQDSKPGIDATVYSPSTDLKIKNDTPGHILIQTSINPKKQTLVFELYGTNDSRVSQVSTPRVWDTVSSPPPLYQDDPTLPIGTLKQVDFASSGAKAAFDYKVTRNGEILQQRTFYSNYRPWQAIYLRGITPQ